MTAAGADDGSSWCPGDNERACIAQTQQVRNSIARRSRCPKTASSINRCFVGVPRGVNNKSVKHQESRYGALELYSSSQCILGVHLTAATQPIFLVFNYVNDV